MLTIDDIELFIHVGYPKTATTWMQTHVYKDEPSLLQIGNSYKLSDWGLHLVAAHDLDFDPEFVVQQVLKIVSQSNQRKVVISWEHLLGDSAFNSDGLVRIANRLKQCFPNAKVIFYIREQLSLIKSLYAQYIQEGGTWKLEDFLSLDYPYRVGLNLVYLDYFKVASLYCELFGQSNVYIQTYELLKQAPENEIERLFQWMQLDTDRPLSTISSEHENVSLSRQTLSLLRLLNYIIPSRFNSLGPKRFTRQPRSRFYIRKYLQEYIDPYIIRRIFTSSNLHIESERQRVIHAQFAKSNALMQSHFNLSLAQQGYPLHKEI
ncbi:sulfotransferase domain-containing protein [Alteromonas sp. CI.11.F.A3]|uniref:sulfotransferase domain-containing protein n=1 Tax=Alteromonas sp. CI.11.F.A3 TaxID=3079555 RepID=UPI0029427A09|nr:sulfotransferase domain-containing protein [Alteromonas sp. CI.11.F.A3]WOI36642.1 sulfotransferase domain-containing protein [Alteromonas sp. CI.11.F.A3]